MAIFLGVDTGGTYTDAVLLKDEKTVLATAKSLTTRHDLAVGISNASQAVLLQSKCDPSSIGLVSLSTTLATNALVEGQGGRIALDWRQRVAGDASPASGVALTLAADF